MILSLPQELVCMIAELCSLGDQASLSCSCRRLCEICIRILYRNDIKNYRSSSVFHAIVHSFDERDTLAILAAAEANGVDFKRCQSASEHRLPPRYRLDATLYSPLHLAARRGRDDVISFLLDRGLLPDSPGNTEGSEKTPLMEAILSHQESTAILLVRHGASIGLRPPNLEAFHAAVRRDLVCLVRVIIEQEGLDVNTDFGYGCTPLVLAACHRRERMARTLLSMGAQAMPTMRRFCQDHAFVSVLFMLDSCPMLMGNPLRVWEVLELVTLITEQRVSPIHKNQQVLALERSLKFLDEAWPRNCGGSAFAA
ncbi:ankyrin repeat [Fusarium albosuccineum]|uniref:Ankyrin repeat n=1 Tax=Fusarium albosuccineum TaxID=1237068 RepID=A0A8H4PKH0_9HYPO|nr:ankyrin repeat [Fusarium albosuccineum]